LPPDAEHEARIIEKLVQVFAAHGYERVKPPLVEFETSLLGGAGQAMANRTFRVMDPVSRRMMGVRADMTLQIARIATTRLARAGRPLRLAYAGEVLRVSGSQLSPEREFVQVGAELIGSAVARADAEAVLLAVAALRGVGVERLSVDLMIPPLVPALLQAAGLDADTAGTLRQALDRKDRAAVAAVGGVLARTLLDLMTATGTAEQGVQVLSALEQTGQAGPLLARLIEVVALIRDDAPDLALTIDPVENRGFEYHSGISFSLFARGVRGELGRGGRYLAEANQIGRAHV
jgi:ATP phosphoribosyltransferase regulatory subunit